MPSTAFKYGIAIHKSMDTENKCLYTVVNEIFMADFDPDLMMTSKFSCVTQVMIEHVRLTF